MFKGEAFSSSTWEGGDLKLWTQPLKNKDGTASECYHNPFAFYPQSLCGIFMLCLAYTESWGMGFHCFKIEKLNVMLKKYENGKNNSMKFSGWNLTFKKMIMCLK